MSRQSRDELLVRLAEDVRELTGSVRTKAQGYGQKVKGRWVAGQKAETYLPGLLIQLELARNATAAGSGHAPPASRTPPGSPAVELLADIDVGVRRQIVKAQEDAGTIRRRSPHRRHLRPTCDMLGYDYRLGYAPGASPATNRPLRTVSTTRMLRSLVQIAQANPDETTKRICTAVHSWANSARVTLSYLAPMVELEAMCEYCKATKITGDGRTIGASLITRADASADVICTTEDCVDDNGETPRWPKASWHRLLQQGSA